MERTGPGGEKRRYPRYDVERVSGALRFAAAVEVLNLSISGMAVETPVRLTVGRRYAFRLADGEGTVSVTGTVVWSFLARTRRRDDGDFEPVYRAGVAFDDVLTEPAQELRRLIERRAVRRPDTRLAGRFPVASLAPAEVATEASFEVRRISLSGALVESSWAPSVDERLELELALDGAPLRTTARVAYVAKPEGAGGTYAVGLEFVETPPEFRDALQRFILERCGEEDREAPSS